MNPGGWPERVVTKYDMRTEQLTRSCTETVQEVANPVVSEKRLINTLTERIKPYV